MGRPFLATACLLCAPPIAWNQGDGTFENRTRESGIHSTEAKTLGLLIADLDSDGRSDIYAACDSTIDFFFRNNGNQPSLLHHEGSTEGNALKLLLIGATANRDALGVRVGLEAGDATHHREVRFSDGYMGSNDPRFTSVWETLLVQTSSASSGREEPTRN
ncbi:MAG: CRTAC1 family protein [Vicinamibacteria bacterium]